MLHRANETLIKDVSGIVRQFRTIMKIRSICWEQLLVILSVITCAINTKNYEDAIRNAICIGGGADSIGCISGVITEALFGI